MEKTTCEECQEEFPVPTVTDEIAVPRCPVCNRVPDEYAYQEKQAENHEQARNACKIIKRQLNEIIEKIEFAQNNAPGVSPEVLREVNQELDCVSQESAERVESLNDINWPTSPDKSKDGSEDG